MNKKGQLEIMITWILALILIFSVAIIFFVWTEPFQAVDNKLSPQVEDYVDGNGRNIKEYLPQVRRNQALIPVLIISGILLIAVLMSLRQDPNHPYQ